MSALHKLLYQRITFCAKCHRSMFVGFNPRYITHLIRHTSINKFLILLAAAALISLYPSTISIMSAKKVSGDFVTEEQRKQEKTVKEVLRRFSDLNAEDRAKISDIVLRNAQSKKLDPKLVAAVIVVESRGNPLAVSGAKSVGIMQIHVPTWGRVVDFTQKNPFDPEVNIDVGTTILSDYLKRYRDLDTALAAYEGSLDPIESAYAAKVLAIYNTRIP